MENKKTGIIFDIDGTLWDANKQICDSWNEYLRLKEPAYGRVITHEEMGAVLGKTMNEIGDAIFPDLEPEDRKRVLDGCMTYEVEYLKTNGGKVYEGTNDTFQKLRAAGYRLFIVSNCQQGYIEDFLLVSGCESLIENHLCFGDTGVPKDRTIRILMDRSGLTDAVYIGDTDGDRLACERAGVPFIFASYGFGTVAAPRWSVLSIREVPEVIQTLALQ